jgi:hypothetical protein
MDPVPDPLLIKSDSTGNLDLQSGTLTTRPQRQSARGLKQKKKLEVNSVGSLQKIFCMGGEQLIVKPIKLFSLIFMQVLTCICESNSEFKPA